MDTFEDYITRHMEAKRKNFDEGTRNTVIFSINKQYNYNPTLYEYLCFGRGGLRFKGQGVLVSANLRNYIHIEIYNYFI